MAVFSPVLRLRKAFRSAGIEEEEAEELVDSLVSGFTPRGESDLIYEKLIAVQEKMAADLRRDLAELRTQVLVGFLLVLALGLTILGLLLAYVD